MSSDPIKVGVAALGRSGWSIHAVGLAEHPLYSLTAVADPESERRQEAVDRFGCRAYPDYQGLLTDPDVDLLVVASPSHTHGPITIEALQAGKHVLVEKPMATSAAEADRMISQAKASDRVLSVYHIRRLDPDFLKIQEILRTGVLGPIHMIRIGTYDFQRRRDWQTLTKFGGGTLNNLGAHLIDQALTLGGGEWSDLFVDLRRVACAGDADDHVKLAFRGRDGAVVEVEMAISVFGGPHWLIMGRYGSLTGDTGRLEWQYYDPAVLPEPELIEGPAPGRRYGSGETIPWIKEEWQRDPEARDTRALFYDKLYASLREGAPLVVPADEIRSLTALFDACRTRAVRR
jgi:scyllo-inositol 2-dehydrogenase (NADP+)